MKLKNNMSEQVKNRLKSLAWRVSMMCLVVILDQIVASASGFNLPTYMVVLVGLVSGEVSKYIASTK